MFTIFSQVMEARLELHYNTYQLTSVVGTGFAIEAAIRYKFNFFTKKVVILRQKQKRAKSEKTVFVTPIFSTLN